MHLAPPESPPAAPRPKAPLEKRARSVPFKRPYFLALLISAIFYLALIGTGAALFAFMAIPNKNSASLLIGFAGFSTFLWLLSFFKRRSCICPLCKGTPYVDSSAHHHEKAIRFFPLNYGTSNVIRSLVRQHFRCQFCGTPYDLLKPFVKQQGTPSPPLSPFIQPRLTAQSELRKADPVPEGTLMP